MWVKYLPFFAGAGGSNGAGREPNPPPQPSSSVERTPAQRRAASGRARGQRSIRRHSIKGIVRARAPSLPTGGCCLPRPESIARAAEVLRGGGVVAFPTETVYGLGALALDAAAVARIFEIKQRPRFDPLIVHVLDRAMLERVVAAGSATRRDADRALLAGSADARAAESASRFPGW